MAVDLNALKTEITTDPNGYGYVQAPVSESVGEKNAALLNEVRASISVDRGVIPAYEIIDAIVAADWTALTDPERRRVELITGAGEVNIRSTNTRSAFLAAFGAADAHEPCGAPDPARLARGAALRSSRELQRRAERIGPALMLALVS